eukprot:31080-Pelagococcus_subviridis.AAC.5
MSDPLLQADRRRRQRRGRVERVAPADARRERLLRAARGREAHQAARDVGRGVQGHERRLLDRAKVFLEELSEMRARPSEGDRRDEQRGALRGALRGVRGRDAHEEVARERAAEVEADGERAPPVRVAVGSLLRARFRFLRILLRLLPRRRRRVRVRRRASLAPARRRRRGLRHRSRRGARATCFRARGVPRNGARRAKPRRDARRR